MFSICRVIALDVPVVAEPRRELVRARRLYLLDRLAPAPSARLARAVAHGRDAAAIVPIAASHAVALLLAVAVAFARLFSVGVLQPAPAGTAVGPPIPSAG